MRGHARLHQGMVTYHHAVTEISCANICVYAERDLTKIDTNRTKIVSRLKAEGLVLEGGDKHDKFAHPTFPGVKIMVPRHNPLTPGVARAIAKATKWK